MYYDQISAGQWPSLKPYLDTCILPITNIRTEQEVWEIKERLHIHNQAKKWIEQMYSGRIVIYPDIHYSWDDKEKFRLYLKEVIRGIKDKGFQYVVLLNNSSNEPYVEEGITYISADGELLSDAAKNRIKQTVLNLWKSSKGKDN
jgi:23S rRNA (pseudouridine1915-N3)-methyltransferase